MYEVQCESCGEKMTTAFGIVGMTQIAAPVEKCPKCKGKVRKVQEPPILDFGWFALYDNGDVLQQFKDLNTQEDETLFQKILDRADKPSHFMLVNVHSNKVYSVDLRMGKISIYATTQKAKPEKETRGDEKYDYRLIYFRRVTQEMNWDGKKLSKAQQKDIQYFLGFQYKNEKGENVKRLLQISKDDEVYIA